MIDKTPFITEADKRFIAILKKELDALRKENSLFKTREKGLLRLIAQYES